MEDKVALQVLSVSYSRNRNGSYAVMLQEIDGDRRLPIVIGASEAQAIDCVLQNVKPPRPLTHDLMALTLQYFEINIGYVQLKQFPSGIYGADLHFIKDDKETVIDARASDAIALALRLNTPIYIDKKVLIENAIHSANEKNVSDNVNANAENNKTSKNDWNNMSDEKLQSLLIKASQEERYELAAEIKRVLDNRKSQKNNL